MRLQYLSIVDPDAAIPRLQSDPDLAQNLLTAGELDALAEMTKGLPPEAFRHLHQNIASMQQQLQAAGAIPAGGDGTLRVVKPAPDGSKAPPGVTSGPAVTPGSVNGHLEKAWHGLHFVFTGKADEAPPPLGYLLCGGTEVGEDGGYGPARALNAAEVRDFRDALAQISPAEFDRRFDLGLLGRNDIYPDCWDEDRSDLLEEYTMYFDQLRADLDQAAAADEGLLIGIV